ncbi:hypothetical protein MKEN_01391400 [Mycena kentingensis (nom. inval.)]|nr:hypothetical protein MKEN_01391400 [Mycena kentingensis (nom. inval.)]
MNPFAQGWNQHHGNVNAGAGAPYGTGTGPSVYGALPLPAAANGGQEYAYAYGYGQQQGYDYAQHPQANYYAHQSQYPTHNAYQATPAPALPPLTRFTFVPNPSANTNTPSSTTPIYNALVTTPNGSGGPNNNATPLFRITTNSIAHGYSVVQRGNYANVAYVEWRAGARSPVVDVYGVVPKVKSGEWLVLGEGKTYRKMTVRDKRYRWVPDESNINLYTDSSRTPHFLGRITSTSTGTALELTDEAQQRDGLLEAVVVAALVLLSGRAID